MPMPARTEWKLVTKRALKEAKTDDVSALSQAVAFRMFLSLFPSVIAGVALFSLFADPSTLQSLVDSLEGVVPGAALSIVEEQLTEVANIGPGAAVTTLVSGVAAGLFAASTAAVALIKALNRAYGLEESRKFPKQRGIALLLTGALVVALLALVLLLVVGPIIERALIPEAVARAGLSAALTAARLAAALLVLMVLFAFVYWIGPNRELPTWEWITPGAVIGVIGWLLLSGGFSLYVRFAGNFDAYGAFAGVAVMLLWLQLSMAVLLLGGEFNSEVERLRNAQELAAHGAAPPVPDAVASLAPVAPRTAAAVTSADGRPLPTSTSAHRSGAMVTRPAAATSPTDLVTVEPTAMKAGAVAAGLTAGVSATAIVGGLLTRRRGRRRG